MKIAQPSMSAGLGYFHYAPGHTLNLLPLEGFDHVQDILLYEFIDGFQGIGAGLGIEVQGAP